MSEPLKHLVSIWYQSESLDVTYSQNQFLGWDFFAVSYSRPALIGQLLIKQNECNTGSVQDIAKKDDCK